MTTKPMTEEERQAARQASREAWESLRRFLETVHQEPELSEPVKQAAAAAAERLAFAAETELRRLDEAEFTRERLAEVQREVAQVRKVVAELYETLEQEEWPTGA